MGLGEKMKKRKGKEKISQKKPAAAQLSQSMEICVRF